MQAPNKTYKMKCALQPRALWELARRCFPDVWSLAPHWAHSAKTQLRGQFGRKSLPKLTDFKCIEHMGKSNIGQNFSLKSSPCIPVKNSYMRTVMFLSFRTGRSGQRVQTQIRAVWSGSTLFAIPAASSGFITLRKSHLIQLLGWLQQIFWVSEYLGFLR